MSEPGPLAKLANRIFKREALLMLTVIITSGVGAVYGQSRIETKIEESAKATVKPVKDAHDDLERRFVRHEDEESLRNARIEKKMDRLEQLMLEIRAAQAAKGK